MAERLFHGNACALQQPHVREIFDNRREQRRRHFQVIQRPTGRANQFGQRIVELAVGDVTVQVGQPARQPVEHRIVDLFGTTDGLASPLDQLPDGHVVTGHTQDGAVQQLVALEPIQRAEGHLAGQVTGNSEDHQQI
ncbi:Uncharacterised protein [Mycobacterium tuberculosis]|nr:Uncharacterised protein [Mycobacterium tuberculosis]CNV03647.1 Uncharacterised protein [Mycobacterium tuberculosis]CNV52330.1 Uncharacterised protein [Mycobacterium tuberculosis]